MGVGDLYEDLVQDDDADMMTIREIPNGAAAATFALYLGFSRTPSVLSWRSLSAGCGEFSFSQNVGLR